VGKAVITVTAPTLSMTYGGSLPGLQCTLTGLVAGDLATVVTGAAAMHTDAGWRASAGSYGVEASGGNLWARNYSFQFVSGVVTVNRAVLTVVAQNEAMTYGGNLPALAYRIAGFLHDDNRATSTTGSPLLTTSATNKSGVGSYPISADLGTLVSVNYSFDLSAAALTVAQAQLTLKADDLSMAMGATPPTLTFGATGFLNGDTLSSASSGLPALTTSATSASVVGSYPISITQGTFVASNYQVKLVKGTLSVTQ